MSNFLVKRSSALAIIEVAFANPNGDPDFDGRPRTLSDNRAWISDVSVKRKFRSLFEDHDNPSFIELNEIFKLSNPEHFHIFESMLRGTDKETSKEATEWALNLCISDKPAFIQKYFDVRLFGGTILEKNKENKKKEKENEKAKYIKSGVVTIAKAVSVAPVDLLDATITKMAAIRDELIEKDSGDMAPGSVKAIQHALFCMPIIVNPNVARHTMTTDEDIEVFKRSFKYIYNLTSSCSRPANSISFRHIWWADHTNTLGSFNERNFFENLTPKKKSEPNEPSTSIDDYEIPLPNFDFAVEDLA